MNIWGRKEGEGGGGMRGRNEGEEGGGGMRGRNEGEE